MRKVLSLKKTSSDKNQKPITKFFKCDNTKALDGGQSLNNAIKNYENEVTITSTTKRKAESPVKCSSNIVAGISNGRLKTDDIHSGNCSKKSKSEIELLQSDMQKQCSPNLSLKNDSNGNCSQKLKTNTLPLSPLNRDNLINDKTENVNSNRSSKFIEKENGINTVVNFNSTPKKDSPKKKLSLMNIKSPKISPEATSRRSPQKSPLKTPTKQSTEASAELSPSKFGSTVKVLTFSQQDVDDIFDDDWDTNNEEELTEDLDLTTMQRCEIMSIVDHTTSLELKLKNNDNIRATCFIEGVWINTPLQVGDIISILAIRNPAGQFVVTSTAGLLALRPDYLISATSVVAGVFCKRKAVLQERWRGIDSANTAMTIGILVHELVQAALTRHIVSLSSLRSEADTIISQSTQILYDAGLSVEEATKNMQSYIAPLAEFMKHYFKSNTSPVDRQKHQWKGNIDEVLDIEENVCCPKLGLKGKIDATLQVTIHERTGAQRAVVPLELKSGRASASAEHRGQLVLYCMMLALQRGRAPAPPPGLLLYLRDKIELHEVSCGHPERRDLMMLRNDLVQHLAEPPRPFEAEQLVDIEEASRLLRQGLPEPVHRESACARCPYLTVCSLHLWHTDGPKVSESHPLSRLRDAALGHLAPQHVQYFLHWSCLLRLEERAQAAAAPLHALWTDSADKRSKRGTCVCNLTLEKVTSSGDRFEHVFRKDNQIEKVLRNTRNGPQEGEFSIVSIDNRPWIAAGVVSLSNEKEICIALERDLSRRLDKDTVYHIDTYESYATTVQNLTNLGVLMEDSDRALRLRTLLIDKRPPQFSPQLHRSVGRLGVKLMRGLNVEQQRAVLRALAAEDYVLLRGLPGTGKTQTISVLIQMLVGLQQRVLVTAHTHSAVDTVLMRLPDSVRVMRLGAAARAAAALRPRCERALAAACATPDQLAQLYDSMEVVGVTCLGATHAMLSRTTFDVCIVDEATQVLQSTVLRPLFAAKRFVLVGDPDQLPPVVKSKAARRLGMEESLFHRLASEQAQATLRLQYRMNAPLVDLANRVAYRGRLQCASPAVARATLSFDREKVSDVVADAWLLSACSAQAERAAVFVEMPACVVDGHDAARLASADEACVALALVDTLTQGGVPAADIGVIAPYRDQVSLLRRALPRPVDASTVDQFQGRDKSVIIFSCSKRDTGEDDKKAKEGEILNDQRRLAVSVTRAKHKLIVIGNRRALRHYDTLRPLIDACHSITIQQDVIRQLFDKFKTFVT